MKQAVGMIETKGLLAMIEAADVMLKSSEVQLLGKNKVGGGLNTVLITGDVAAVKTAVQAAAASVERLGTNLLAGAHVIARPEVAPELFVQAKTLEKSELEPVELASEETIEVVEVIEPELLEDNYALEQHEVDPKEALIQELNQMKVVDLRKLAKEQTNFSIAKKEIYRTSKEKLIAALIDFLITNE
ncbi:BMC domain-containing protein [Enterococcus sp. UD-01]|jgi:microcompartment protein CcmL/EutN|uniref:BMC domain-containing protein n=1 Tax=Enterococcus sp. UD-01 TaxID=3373911 RepID=UPI003835A5D7